MTVTKIMKARGQTLLILYHMHRLCHFIPEIYLKRKKEKKKRNLLITKHIYMPPVTILNTPNGPDRLVCELNKFGSVWA